MKVQDSVQEPTRAEVDALRGPTVIEFGSLSCSICRAAQPAIVAARSAHPALQHIKVEDGSGRRLGRSFGVKLWPTLVFLLDGRETARLVRPAGGAVEQAFADLASLATGGAAAGGQGGSSNG